MHETKKETQKGRGEKSKELVTPKSCIYNEETGNGFLATTNCFPPSSILQSVLDVVKHDFLHSSYYATFYGYFLN